MPQHEWTPEDLARISSLSRDQAGVLADLFRLLGDTSRLRVALLCAAGPLPVTGIADRLEMSISLVSHHLRLLRAARIVSAERQGRQVFYSAADDHVRCILMDMADHMLERMDDDDQ